MSVESDGVRVALVNNFFSPRIGGSAHFTEAIAHELGRLGHEVLVVTAAQNAPEGREMRGTFTVHRVRAWSAPPLQLAYGYEVPFCFSREGVRTVWRVLDEFRPDVVHENSQIFDLSLMASGWAAHRGAPVVLTIHTALIHEQAIRGLVLSVLDRLVARMALELPRAHVVAPDVFMCQYVATRYGLRSSGRMSSIPIGIDVAHLDSGRGERARNALGIGERPMLLSLGHVIPFRDRLGLVEALPEVLREIPQLAVIVAGQLCDRRFLHRARELGVEDALIVLGSVGRDEVNDLIAGADVGCHELSGIGFGTASLELMGAGVVSAAAIRADNFPGVPLRNWENVVMVPRGDPAALAHALVRLLRQRDLRERIGDAGRQLVRSHFTIQRVAEQYVMLYDRLIEVPRHARRPAPRAPEGCPGVQRLRPPTREPTQGSGRTGSPGAHAGTEA